MSKNKHNDAEQPRDTELEEKLAEAETDATDAEEAAVDEASDEPSTASRPSSSSSTRPAWP